MGFIEKDYRVCFPDKGIFVSRDHNWAFATWEMSKLFGETENATLIHVDSHLDDIWDGILVEGLNEIKNQKDVYSVTEKLKIENFIWAGFATNAIDNIIYVTRKNNRFQAHNPFDFTTWDFSDVELEKVKMLLEHKEYTGDRLESIEELMQSLDNKLSKYIKGKPVILDLDLDYFNLSNNLFEPELIDDDVIRKKLRQLKDLYEWDLITVALSPIYCGGDDECWHIYEIFLEVFDLNLSKAEVW